LFPRTVTDELNRKQLSRNPLTGAFEKKKASREEERGER